MQEAVRGSTVYWESGRNPSTISLMPTDHILALLIAERDKIDRAIQALGVGTKRRGRPPGSGVKRVEAVVEPTPTAVKTVKKKWTPAQKEEARARAKAMWAARKKAAKKKA